MSLVIAFLFVIALLLVVLCGLVSWNIYLSYKGLIRPEAPCFAGALADRLGNQNRFGMVEVDSSHPAYNMLTKMGKGQIEKSSKPQAGDGNYL
jgi:hypothetical protein